jgi:hypothetical protein
MVSLRTNRVHKVLVLVPCCIPFGEEVRTLLTERAVYQVIDREGIHTAGVSSRIFIPIRRYVFGGGVLAGVPACWASWSISFRSRSRSSYRAIPSSVQLVTSTRCSPVLSLFHIPPSTRVTTSRTRWKSNESKLRRVPTSPVISGYSTTSLFARVQASMRILSIEAGSRSLVVT